MRATRASAETRGADAPAAASAAAGVMPSMRAAWARVAGRRASSFWRTSADRPADARHSRNRPGCGRSHPCGRRRCRPPGARRRRRSGRRPRAGPRCRGRMLPSCGPDGQQLREARRPEQASSSKAGAAAAVLVDVQAVAGGLVGRQGQAGQQAPAVVQRLAFGGERRPALGDRRSQGRARTGVRRWSALSARRRRRYSAREVNMR